MAEINSNNTSNINNEEKVDLSKLSFGDWLKIAVVLLAGIYVTYRCILPFRAEYAYREAYNNEASGNRDGAITKYEKAVRFAPWETHYFVQLGKLYEDKARASQNKEERLVYIKKAENIYKHCLDISPTNPWYVNRMGEVYGLYSTIETDPAKQKAWLDRREKAILDSANLDKNNALFQMAVAYLYHQRGDLDKALEKYNHVLEIDDRFGEAYFNMADIYRQRGNTAKQMELYKAIIEKNPGFKNAHLQLGRMYEMQGNMDAAIKEYIEEVNLDKSNEPALQILGAALYRKGDWVNVAKVYHRLSVVKPDNSRYYLLHAQAAAKLGNLQEALDALESAQVLMPNDKQINQNILAIKNLLSPRKAAPAPAPASPSVQ